MPLNRWLAVCVGDRAPLVDVVVVSGVLSWCCCCQWCPVLVLLLSVVSCPGVVVVSGVLSWRAFQSHSSKMDGEASHGGGGHRLEDIPFDEFDTSSDSILGGGAFGIVKRRFWLKRGILVAMKQMYDEKNFEKEEYQLALVKNIIDEDKRNKRNERYWQHIITIFGKTIGKYRTGPARNQALQSYIVMEYANSKCLHDLLHKSADVTYGLEHALSWSLQCAYGVYYLHMHKLIHRDLKPLNLLLFNKGELLKICDFGTVRQVTKQMTNNKGSSQYMAPEVFRSQHYSNKCDVFSWAIIFWEILHRDEPFKSFDNIYTISWAIEHSERPPLAESYPLFIKQMLTLAWSQLPEKRPSMEDIVSWLENTISSLGYTDLPHMQSLTQSLNMPQDAMEDLDPLPPAPLNLNLASAALAKQKLGHKRSCSSGASQLLETGTADPSAMTRHLSEVNLAASTDQQQEETIISELMDKFNAYLMLDKVYQPSQPDVTNSKSVSLFEEHRKHSVVLFRQLYEVPILENMIKNLEQLDRDLSSDKSLERERSANHILEYPSKLYNDNLELKKVRASIVHDLVSKNFTDSLVRTTSTEHGNDVGWVLVQLDD